MILTALVSLALAAAPVRVETPEGIALEPIPGVELAPVEDGAWRYGLWARSPSGDAAVSVEWVGDARSFRGGLDREARHCAARSGAECWEAKVDVRGEPRSSLHRVLSRTGALRRWRGPFTAYVLFDGSRAVTVVSGDRALAKALADAVRALPAGSDPRAVGCWVPEEIGLEPLCLAPGGALASCGRGSSPLECARAAREARRGPDGWSTSRGLLALHARGRVAVGRYRVEEGSLLFRGARWKRLESAP